jgi:hypothetical protein
MGIYGFLSAAYQETANKSTIVDTQIAFLEQKRDFYQEDVDRYDIELQRISDNIATLSQAKSRDIQVRDTSSATGFRNTISTTELRLAQQRIESEEENRKLVQAQRSEAADSLQKYQVGILDANIGNDIAAELGPLKYLSGLTGISMDRIINILLLVIIFVFDPLAVSMVIAANYAFDIARDKGREEKEAREDWEKFFEAVEEGAEPNEKLKTAAERYEKEVNDDEDDDKLQDEITLNTLEDEWEIEEDTVEEDPEPVEEPAPDIDIRKRKPLRVVEEVLERTPTSRKVRYNDGTIAIEKKEGDVNKIIYL